MSSETVSVRGVDGKREGWYDAVLLLQPSREAVMSQHAAGAPLESKDMKKLKLKRTHVGWVHTAASSSDIRAVIRLAKDKAEAGKPQYEELLPAAARTVWNANSVSIERVMQQHNRQTAPGGTVVPIVAPAVFAALSKRHLDFTALKESVQQWWNSARDLWVAQERSRKSSVMFNAWSKGGAGTLVRHPNAKQWFAQVVARIEFTKPKTEQYLKHKKPATAKKKGTKRGRDDEQGEGGATSGEAGDGAGGGAGAGAGTVSAEDAAGFVLFKGKASAKKEKKEKKEKKHKKQKRASEGV